MGGLLGLYLHGNPIRILAESVMYGALGPDTKIIELDRDGYGCRPCRLRAEDLSVGTLLNPFGPYCLQNQG